MDSFQQMNRRLLGCGLVFVTAAAGCTSFRTTMLDDDGCCPEKVKVHLKGIPTTMTVPTHVKISLYETRYGAVDATSGKITAFDLTSPMTATHKLKYEFVSRKELYAVDFKRPLSGTLKTKIGLNADQQYITSVDNKVVDRTVDDVSALVNSVITGLPTLKGLGAKAGNDTHSEKVLEFTSLVATDIFDIHDPQLEAKVQQFAETYLNNCKGTCPPKSCP